MKFPALPKSGASQRPRVVVMGLGYVGFPLVCALAGTKRYEVYAYDIDEEKVRKVNRKLPPIEGEKINLKNLSITATTDETCLADARYVIICVPTPVNHQKKPDLGPVSSASKAIARNLKPGQMIILESTVNPGVCEEVVQPILESTGLKAGTDFEIAHCPERINPGDAYWHVKNIPRNIGALTPEGTHHLALFYRTFIKAPIHEVSSIKAAEATKIVENTFRDINIAYVNELAQFFDKMGLDIMEVLKGASTKPFAFLPHFPGCGVGGHCIPVDPYYLIYKARDLGFDHRLVRMARLVNNSMPSYTIRKLMRGLEEQGHTLKSAPVGLLGLSYKARTDDTRESPALEIQKELESQGAQVLTYDPYCNGHSNATLDTILTSCRGLIVATDHPEFATIRNWKNIKVIIDGRNCLNMQKIQAQNIYYRGIGRGGA